MNDRCYRHLVLSLFLIGALLLVSCASTSNSPVRPTLSMTEVLTLEGRWLSALAKNDVGALNDLLDRDFVVTSKEGVVRRKAEEIETRIGPDAPLDKKYYAFEDVVLRRPGIVIVVGLTYTRVKEGDSPGDPQRYTAVWMYTDRGWQLTAVHLGVASS